MGMISIVCPVYNEGRIVGEVIKGVKQVMDASKIQYEIVAIDDCSSDNSYAVLQSLGIEVYRHPYNKGYGASLKTGVRNSKGDVIVFIDSDGQHDPKDILRLIENIDEYDLVVGARSFKSKGSMHRKIANKIYNLFASYLTEIKVKDLTSGFRAFKADLLKECLYMLPNKFSASATTTIAFAKEGYNIKYIPIEVENRVGKSKINILDDGVKFFVVMFKIVVLFHPFKIFFPASLGIFILGVFSLIDGSLAKQKLFMPNSSVLLMVSSVFVFLIGLVSEQVAMLRVDYKEMHYNKKT